MRVPLLLALVLALGLGLALWWSGSAAPVPATGGNQAATPAGVAPDEEGDLAEPALGLAQAERAVAGEEGTIPGTSAPSWVVRGRMECPAGVPPEESVRVVLRDADGLERGSAQVERSGTFSVEVPASLARVRLELQARFVYLARETHVERPMEGAGAARVRLVTELGGLLEVRVRQPEGHDSASTDEALLELHAAGDSARPALVAKGLGQGLFEFRSVPTDVLYGLTLECEAFVSASRKGLRLLPGQVEALELDLIEGVTLAGRVRSADAGVPTGVRLRVARRNPLRSSPVRWIDTRSERLDASGTFVLQGLPPGELRIEARADDLRGARLELGLVEDRESREDLELVLTTGQSISGRVSWPDGSAAMDALVRLREVGRPFGGEQRVRSDASGRFRVAGLSDVDHILRAEAKQAGGGAAWAAHLAAVPAGSADVQLVLAAGAQLRGSVQDERGLALERFTVVARPVEDVDQGLARSRVKQRFRDAEDGSFVLDGLAPGAWDLQVTARGHADSALQRAWLPLENQGWNFSLHREGALVGRVFDAAGEPLAGARVEARAAGAETRSEESDDEGRFHIERVAPGALQLVASLEGQRASAALDVDLAAGEVREGLELRLRPGARILGRVDPSIEDFVRRKVLAMPASSYSTFSTLCDADGTFEFEGLEPGTWSVMFDWQPSGGGGSDWVEGYGRRAEQELELYPAETTEVLLGRVEPDSVVLQGRVLRAGEVCPGYLVYVGPVENTTAKPAAMPMNIVRTDAQGAYELVLPEPGPYRFSVGADTRFQVRYFHEVPDEPFSSRDFELPSGSLSGRVQLVDGSPVASHALMLVHADAPLDSRSFGDLHTTASDAEGAFAFEDIQPGRYLLRTGGWGASSSGLGVRVLTELELSQGNARDGVLVELDRGAVLAGVVLDAAGAPVQGARLRVLDDAGSELFVWKALRSDHTGSFRLPEVGAGEVQVLAEGPQGERASTSVVLAPGTTSSVILGF